MAAGTPGDSVLMGLSYFSPFRFGQLVNLIAIAGLLIRLSLRSDTLCSIWAKVEARSRTQSKMFEPRPPSHLRMGLVRLCHAGIHRALFRPVARVAATHKLLK